MDENQEARELIRKQKEKLESYQEGLRSYQDQVRYFNDGLQQLEWFDEVLRSPCGTDREIVNKVVEGVRGWEGIPPSQQIAGATGAYGYGTSAMSDTANRISIWKGLNVKTPEITNLELQYKNISQNENKLQQLERYLRHRKDYLGELFREARKKYELWKATRNDIPSFSNAIRNVMDKFKGELNLIALEVSGRPPRDDFSWPKMISAIGKKNERLLLIQKTKYENLWSKTSEYLHVQSAPEDSKIENIYSEFVNLLDSILHLLNPVVKEKYFSIPK